MAYFDIDPTTQMFFYALVVAVVARGALSFFMDQTFKFGKNRIFVLIALILAYLAIFGYPSFNWSVWAKQRGMI